MWQSAMLVAVFGVWVTGVAFAQGGALVLFDGKSLNAWDQVGDANWTIVDGAVQATEGKGGHLVSKEPFGDFELTAEFWVESAEDEQRHLHPLSGSRSRSARRPATRSTSGMAVPSRTSPPAAS